MPRVSLDNLIEILRRTLEARGFKVLETAAESRSTRLIAEFCRGPEISLQIEVEFQGKNDGAIWVAYMTVVRWTRVEELLRDLRPPLPDDVGAMPPKVRQHVAKVRNRLWSIAP